MSVRYLYGSAVQSGPYCVHPMDRCVVFIFRSHPIHAPYVVENDHADC